MQLATIADRVSDVRERVERAAARGAAQRVTIVAVTKGHGPAAVESAWEAGLRDVGENRVQEALAKMDAVPQPVRWHLIGHLQRNKVRALDRFELLHSLDSQRLARAVHEHGLARGRPVRALLQVNVSGEASKGGVDAVDVERVGAWLRELSGVRVVGVMTMAPLGAGEGELRRVFEGARRSRDALVALGLPATELSMGMSDDFEVAVEEGATMVRLGTILFGARDA